MLLNLVVLYYIQWGVTSVRAQATPNVIFLLNYYIAAIKSILEL